MPNFAGRVSHHEGLDSNGVYIHTAAVISNIEVEAFDNHVFVNVRLNRYYDGTLSRYTDTASLMIDPDITLYDLTRKLFANDPRNNEVADNVNEEVTYLHDGCKILARELAQNAIAQCGMDYKAMDYFAEHWGFAEN